jgi:hypothetical protein
VTSSERTALQAMLDSVYEAVDAIEFVLEASKQPTKPKSKTKTKKSGKVR